MSDAHQPALGSVASLWRYPVKSMMGEELNAADLTEAGLAGDRAYALFDPVENKVISAKNPRKWPRLFEFRADYLEPPRAGQAPSPIRITLPDGSTVSSGHSDVAAILAKTLGREVLLMSEPRSAADTLEEYWPDLEGLDRRDTVTEEKMPPGTFFDGAAVHLLTTATIDRLRQSYPQGRFEMRRFRPNIVVVPTAASEGFIENDWIGRTVRIGREVCLRVTGPCPRCVMTTLAQADLPHDMGILRTAVQQNRAHVGVYAAVLHGGRIRRGDPLRLDE